MVTHINQDSRSVTGQAVPPALQGFQSLSNTGTYREWRRRLLVTAAICDCPVVSLPARPSQKNMSRCYAGRHCSARLLTLKFRVQRSISETGSLLESSWKTGIRISDQNLRIELLPCWGLSGFPKKSVLPNSAQSFFEGGRNFSFAIAG